ncbi:MAG TPA: hypothetical protein VHG28_09460 [Longimicrobiaceae bacterium]|nr:hypothetical protein [Longimicrobiaceae bacterium]
MLLTKLCLSAGLAYALSGSGPKAPVQGVVPPLGAAADTIYDLLRQSADAVGGLDHLQAVRAVRVEEVGHERMISTATRSDGPRRLAAQKLITVRHRAPDGLRRHLEQFFVTRPQPTSSTLVVSDGVAMTERGGVTAAGTAFDLAVGQEELALAPERVLLTALGAGNSRLLPDRVIDGARYHVVAFRSAGMEVELSINGVTKFPERVVVVRAYPTNVFWAMWGDIRFETVWSSWSLGPSGIWYPRQRTTSLNGEPFREYIVTHLDLAANIPRDSLTIPDSVRQAFRQLAASADVQAGSPADPVPIAEGVVLLRTGYQSVIVRQPDGLVIIEAPESAARSRAVLSEAGRRFPGLPVKAVVSTSPMWMHIGGIREYAARGIPIFALDTNIPILRRLLAAPHRSAPDSLARRPRSAPLHVVRGPLQLGRGSNRITLIPARGQQGASMLLAYLPEHRLLYASDVLIPERFEPNFAAGYRAELIRTVERLRLPVSAVFALHLPLIPWRTIIEGGPLERNPGGD